ncbi:DUF4212 domain-containing protein [Thalassotalea litorea]|uniref:DUF4212 domain-containing protein n=1 Tax=Thalassotalea litorea TaxID=2020715 RepID=A0A5R9IQ38_9GAMM|nr:DUF4212 domain-containing protein [Thalassotalea litorea]TLU65336.1 DUF4212 domain-containing protein [Thalassotalea litorea]
MNQSVNEQKTTEPKSTRLSGAQYWRENLKLIAICLTVWFAVSFGCGIVLVEPLNEIRLGGYKLGFWFAQQGSIYTFVALVFYYTRQMNKLDKKFGIKD